MDASGDIAVVEADVVGNKAMLGGVGMKKLQRNSPEKSTSHDVGNLKSTSNLHNPIIFKQKGRKITHFKTELFRNKDAIYRKKYISFRF